MTNATITESNISAQHGRTVTDLLDTDINWDLGPVQDDSAAERSDSFPSLTDAETRAYCQSLRADVRTVTNAFKQTLAMLEKTTLQLDRCRAQNRELRELNRHLAEAAQ